MKHRRLVILVIFALSMLLIAPSSALATASSSLIYNEKDLGDGKWQYDYTFYNTSDAGELLYSVYFDFGQDRFFDWINIPSGWDSVLNGFTPDSVRYVDTYSTDPGDDIAAGFSLDSFSFMVDYQIGNISYDAYFRGEQIVSGTTAIVPEPISSILFITGGVTLGFRRYFHKKKKTKWSKIV